MLKLLRSEGKGRPFEKKYFWNVESSEFFLRGNSIKFSIDSRKIELLQDTVHIASVS